MEYAISEILMNGDEVNEGEEGLHITTDYVNYIYIYRYNSQDVVVKGIGQVTQLEESIKQYLKFMEGTNDI